MNFVTLDDEQFRQFANDDPAGFMRGLDRVVIDEVQRAPGLILALKKAVDEDPRPGRFLVTGSVDLFKGMISPDSPLCERSNATSSGWTMPRSP